MKSIVFAATVATALPAMGNIATREVTYEAGKVKAEGFLAFPDDGQQHPGVLVVHEWWGHNDYARKRARMLAEMGYTALAVDMYGGGKTADHPKDASAFSTLVRNSQGEMTARFRGALEFLHAQEQADPEKTAAIGYCFGGNVVLQMARNGLAGLDGVASFHGALVLATPNPPAKVTAKVLVCNGGGDLFVKPEQIERFQEEMRAAGADLTYVNYKDAMHSFTNPGADEFAKKFGLPLAYDAAADEASWAELTSFLEELFDTPGE